MIIKLMTLEQKAKEMGISYRWAKELKKRGKIVAVYMTKTSKGEMKDSRLYYLPKLKTMELLEFCFDHDHVGNPCVCRKFIDEIKARQTRDSEIV